MARPEHGFPLPIASVRDVSDALKQVWARPGTRLGFFGHMATQFPMMVFSLLWGLPYLISAQHHSESTASMLIMVVGPEHRGHRTRDRAC